MRFCKDCRWYSGAFYVNECQHPSNYETIEFISPVEGPCSYEKIICYDSSLLNRNCDCKNYEEPLKWWKFWVKGDGK